LPKIPIPNGLDFPRSQKKYSRESTGLETTRELDPDFKEIISTCKT
jgi:hypothetical protein